VNPIRPISKAVVGVLAAAALSFGALPASPAAAAPAPKGVTAAASGEFYLHNGMNNKCLEILSFDNSNGAAAGLWDCWGGANQRWYWDGQQIRNVMNNKCLELLSFNNSNGARAGMWDCWGGANQRWYY
jgi:hypothetical protein